MFRKLFGIFAATILLTFQFVVGSACAVQLDEATLTVPLNESGDTIVLSLKQFKEGKRLFDNTCSQCHVGGVTKTNLDVGLEPETLALATPNRNNIEGLVDYLKNPTTYDGEEEISELHPSTKSPDLFPEMRNLTDDDLVAIAGYILVQPKVDPTWGGGKIVSKTNGLI